MKKWTLPTNYFGESWNEYYVFLGQHRDSDSITRSNFKVGLERLGGETGEVWMEELGKDIDMVIVVRESHWAVGWVEWIGIHESNTEAIKLAEAMEESLEDYPVLDEMDWSNLEYEEAMSYWDSMSLSMKVDYCRNAKVSVFAARRNYDLPDRLYERLTQS